MEIFSLLIGLLIGTFIGINWNVVKEIFNNTKKVLGGLDGRPKSNQ